MATKSVGAYMSGQFAAAQKLVIESFAPKMKQAVQDATDGMIKLLAQEKGITEEQARSLVKREAARQQLIDYGRAAEHWIGNVAQAAFLGAAGAVGSLIGQGLSLSADGQVMAARFQQLALSVQGLFGPEVRAVSQWIQDVTNYLRDLTPEQKDNLVWWIKLTGGLALAAFGFKSVFGWAGLIVWVLVEMKGVLGEINWKWVALAFGLVAIVRIVPQVVSGIMYIVNALRAFNAMAFIAKVLSGDWKTALAALGIGLAGAGAIWGLSKLLEPEDPAKSPGKKLSGDRGQAARAVSGPEAISAAFDRINVDFLNATAGIKSPAEITNDKLDITNMKLEDIVKLLGGQKGPIRK